LEGIKLNKERFEKSEMSFGCGYWNVCDDHACPCHPNTQVSKGFDEDVYRSMEEARKNRNQ